MVGYGALENFSSEADLCGSNKSEHVVHTVRGYVRSATLLILSAAAAVLLCVAFSSVVRSSGGGMQLESPVPKGEIASQQLAGGNTMVYLGNGCFWARQYALVRVEQHSPAFRDRDDAHVTALAGYAGATALGPQGLVCYHGGPPGTLYETLGDCEVVQVALDKGAEVVQFKALLHSFFGSFVRNAAVMLRPDPQDAGGAYRSAIGIPGGVDGPLMPLIRDSNVDGMQLLAGKGGEEDQVNLVWIYDSGKFAFHRAEEYHQFHKGPSALKTTQQALARINPTGCPEKGNWR
mmetsp:Transcript_4870/g.7155  ORF Transcript_4870/g.7155 Transcript_4870/m.7155 type:complete len:291 (+) Transcript_4870:1-873(+)